MIVNKIPILMITYNRLSYTKKAIASILENTDNFELFIWDNNSTDGTIKFLRSLKNKRIKIHYSDSNLGLIYPMNCFFDKYKDYPYISKVDNDTIVPQNWLKKLLEVMDSFPLFSVQAEHYIGLDYKLKDNQEFFSCFPYIEFNESKIYLSHFNGGSGILIRRNLIDGPISEMKGTLNGWASYCGKNFRERNYICGFYMGVFVELLDMIDTNQKIYEFPQYQKELKEMGRKDFGKVLFNRDKFLKLGESIKYKFESLL